MFPPTATALARAQALPASDPRVEQLARARHALTGNDTPFPALPPTELDRHRQTAHAWLVAFAAAGLAATQPETVINTEQLQTDLKHATAHLDPDTAQRLTSHIELYAGWRRRTLGLPELLRSVEEDLDNARELAVLLENQLTQARDGDAQVNASALRETVIREISDRLADLITRGVREPEILLTVVRSLAGRYVDPETYPAPTPQRQAAPSSQTAHDAGRAQGLREGADHLAALITNGEHDPDTYVHELILLAARPAPRETTAPEQKAE